MRTIEVTQENGETFEVSGIPDDAKITFGGVNPSAPNLSGYALRIYKGGRASEGNQLGVFQKVASFRDLSLVITKKEKKDWVR